MIGKDEKQEEVTFKVADRRKFNADGSLKEGVTLEPEKPAEAAERTIEPTGASTQDVQTEGFPAKPVAQEEPPYTDGDEDIPGADDPASFVNFLSTLATNAAAALGAVPHPATGKRTLDLDSAKFWLDILGMLKEKTAGNLHPQEERLLEGLLGDLRFQYVQMVRASEEKLKEQAAKKFSGADILGKK
jgi:hypothetical protein